MWKENALVYKFPAKACSSLKKHMPEFYYIIFKKDRNEKSSTCSISTVRLGSKQNGTAVILCSSWSTRIQDAQNNNKHGVQLTYVWKSLTLRKKILAEDYKLSDRVSRASKCPAARGLAVKISRFKDQGLQAGAEIM